jgi:hypothetical protein
MVLSDSGFATLSGAIGLPGDSVLDRFVAPVSGLMAVSQQAAGGTALDSVLSVYGASQTLLGSDDDGGGGRNSRITLAVTAGQTYYVRAAGFGTSTGLFTLTLATDRFGHDFAGAAPISLDATGSGRISGAIGWSGDTDVFQFVATLTQDQTIKLDAVTGSGFDGVLRVYDSQQKLVAQNDDDGDDDYDSQVQVSLTAGQTYFLAVAGFGSSIGGYNVLVGNGLGSSLASAFPIPFSPQGFGTQSGSIDQPGEVTRFRVVAPASGVMTVDQLSAPEDHFVGVLSVRDASGTVLATQADQPVNQGPSTLGDNDELSKVMAKVLVGVTAGQVYYLQVGGLGSSTGDYVIDLAINDADAEPTSPVPREVALDPTSHSAGVDGQIALPGDLEVFRLTAPLAGELVINQTAPPGTFLGAVTGTQPGSSWSLSDGAAIGGEDPEDAGKGYSRVAFQVNAGQTYLIQVSGVATSIGSFHMDLREFPTTSQNLSTQDMDQGVTASQMVAAILGPGNTTVQIVSGSVSYVGAPNASGLFAGGSGILDTREGGAVSFDSGIVLTNGNASNIIGPNDNDAASEVNGLPGSPLLDPLVRGGTLDASTLTFQFIPTTNVIQLQYVFASEEYDTYIGTPFDDVFGFFVNGADYARVPGTGTPLAGTGQIVSVNTINNQVNSQYYIDNTFSPLGGFGRVNTQMNGLTRVLTLEAPVKAGQVNTITLTIADALDPQIDSAVLIRAGSFQAVHEQVTPLAGQQVFSQLVQTVSALKPGIARGALTTAQLQLAIQQAVVNGVFKAAHLTGDFLVIPVDPVDFTLTGPNGLQVSSTAGQGVSATVANVFAASDGANQLLVIPNANPGEYQVSLVGAGSGASIFGASFISPSSGAVTSVLLSGNLNGTSATWVLDFQDPSGQLTQESIGSSSPSPSTGGGAAVSSTGLGSTAVIALGVVITPVTFLGVNGGSIEAAASSAPGQGTALAAVTQPLLNAPSQPTSSSSSEPPSTSGASPTLSALLEELGTGLVEGRARLGTILSPGWERVLGEIIDAMGPGWKASRGLLGYVIALLPSRLGTRGLSQKGTLRSYSPRVALPPWDALPTPTNPTEASGRAPGVGFRAEAPDRTDEARTGSAASALIAAGMGLARLADRQALRLAVGGRKRRPARGGPLSIPRWGKGPHRVDVEDPS